MEKVIIIGSGVAGYMAATYLGRAGLPPIIIEGNQVGGQLTTTDEVENFAGFPDGINGQELMLLMRKQAERFGAHIINGFVTDIDIDNRPFKITYNNFSENVEVESESVIVATGATAKYLDIKGESEAIGSGVSACAVCDGFFFRGKDVAVIGGGDTAFEEALFLTNFVNKLYLVVRSNNIKASKILQERVAKNEKIELLTNLTPVEVVRENFVVSQLKTIHSQNGTEINLNVQGIFVAIGHKPNTDFLKGKVVLDEQGYIVTMNKSTHTNVEGVFACGDVQDPVYRQAITAAGSGAMAALDCERWLSEKE